MHLVGFDDATHLKIGVPRLSPSALASGVSATMQPSLLDSTHTGLPLSPGWNTFSTEQKKLLQSTRAIIAGEGCGLAMRGGDE